VVCCEEWARLGVRLTAANASGGDVKDGTRCVCVRFALVTNNRLQRKQTNVGARVDGLKQRIDHLRALSGPLSGLKFLRSASLLPPRKRTRESNSSRTSQERTAPRSATTHPML